MGFFERFRKRVQEVADVTDLDELTAEEGTEEAQEALPPPRRRRWAPVSDTRR